MKFGVKSRYHSDSESAFALVVTLVLLVLASVVAVTLITTTTLERTTAKAVNERYSAELAADSGLEAAKNALQAQALVNSFPVSRTQNDDFLVVSSNDSNGVPYYFVGSCEDSTNSGNTDYTAPGIQYFPLYSGGVAQPGLPVTAGAAPTPNPSLATGSPAQQQLSSSVTLHYPLLFTNAPYSTWQANIQTNWQTLPPTGTGKQYRFTYWIEDLAGYTDAKVAGNTEGTGATNLRTVGYDPKEEGLFTLFSPSGQSDPGTTYASTFLVPNHPALFTRPTTRLGTTSGSADDLVCLTSLSANLGIDAEQAIIPFGLGYKNEGLQKTNLNSIIANSANDAGITQITTAINTNLPNFDSARRGGLDLSQGYNETLAANIIDYADSDSTPLVGKNASSGKYYRGVDLMPFVVEFYEMYIWDKDYYQKGNGGDYFVDIRIRSYVELWNMFGEDITSGTLTFNDMNRAGIQVGVTTTSFDAVTPVDSQVTVNFSTSNKLLANESKAFLACERVYTFDAGPTAGGQIQIGDKTSPGNHDKESSYDVQWNGVSYDRPGITTATSPNFIERNNFILEKAGSIQIVGTAPGLRYANTAGLPNTQGPPYNLGDPRAAYYVQDEQYDNSYLNNSAWGGEMYLKTLAESGGWVAAESRVHGWADSGHNSARGTAPPSATADPTTIAEQPVDSGKAPARISNQNLLHSITELSYIYDPFQWNPFSTTPATTTDVDNGWGNTWKTAFKGPDGTYGSHSTLRIGRPEHKSFDVDGTRAWQLLDIFTAGDPIGSALSSQISTLGKINVNTASFDTLRVLGAGIKIGNLNPSDVDQSIQPTDVYGPQNTNAGDVFANDVIAQRQKHPFISTSQLANLSGSNGELFFGNPDQWPAGGPTEWNDPASEEYFGKLYNFTTVRSRNFRIFVTGQVVDTKANDPYTGQPPKVISTANKVYEVYLQPTRDSNSSPPGNITGQTCVVTYASDVR